MGANNRIITSSIVFMAAWFAVPPAHAAHKSVRYRHRAHYRHVGGVSSRTLGYARFLPIYYRNALLYRERYPARARWLYRGLLAVGMGLRLLALPFRSSVPRSRSEAALAYIRTLGLAMGWTPANSETLVSVSPPQR